MRDCLASSAGQRPALLQRPPRQGPWRDVSEGLPALGVGEYDRNPGGLSGGLLEPLRCVAGLHLRGTRDTLGARRPTAVLSVPARC